MLSYILYGLFIFACIVLVTVILLQPGKASAGALFSSGLSSTAFGPRGTASVLAKVTIGAAAVFMLVALMLSLPAVTGTQSLLQTVGTEAPSPSPAALPETVPPTTEGVAPATEGASPGTEGAAPAASPDTTASPSEK